MGLDMVPMGKPKPGYEKRFEQIFNLLYDREQQSLTFLDKLKGKKVLTKEQLAQEWFDIQIPSYETIGAPMVGRDAIADQWIKEMYQNTNKDIGEAEFIKNHQGYYVIALAKHKEGIASYGSVVQDENAFRGQLLDKCDDLIGEKLVNEAWESKLAEEALDYGKRLFEAIDIVAKEKNMEHLKDPNYINETEVDSMETRVHFIYCLSRWLIFYGTNGHGYEADY